MKRYLTVMLAMILVVGCSAKTAQTQPQLKEDPAQLANRAWAALSEDSSAQSLTAETACLLLDIPSKDIAAAYGFFDAESPQGAQLFLLQAAAERSPRLHNELEERLELVRQTAAATKGKTLPEAEYGCLVAAGEWCALIIPANMDDSRTKQARQIILQAFE